MNCHRCNTEMVKGRTQSASIDTFFGMFFENENGDVVRKSIFGKEYYVLAGEEVQSYYCPKCKLLAMMIESR